MRPGSSRAAEKDLAEDGGAGGGRRPRRLYEARRSGGGEAVTRGNAVRCRSATVSGGAGPPIFGRTVNLGGGGSVSGIGDDGNGRWDCLLRTFDFDWDGLELFGIWVWL